MKRLTIAVAIVALAACTQPPMKPKYEGTVTQTYSTPGAAPAPAATSQPASGSTVSSNARLSAYRVAVIKDLVIEDVALAYVRNPNDRAALEASKAAIISEFGARFREDIAKRGYFETLVPEASGPNTAIIQPKAIVLDPGTQTGMFTGTPTRIDIMVYVTDASTGAAVGSYLTPTGFLPKTNLPAVNRLTTWLPATASKVGAGMVEIR